MTTHRQELFDAFSKLFRYPDEEYSGHARQLGDLLRADGSQAVEQMARFLESVAPRQLDELEESYTRTFDLNPTCSLEIGWHLFGEEYVRGLFMVRMRNEMRDRGLEETGELPDHVVHVLAVLGAMEPEPARELARACVCPALGKMLVSFDQPVKEENGTVAAEQSFRPLVEALTEVLLEEFDLPRTALEAREEDPVKQNGVDPLHCSPCGSGGCGGEIVPLNVSLPENSACPIDEE